MTSVLVDTNILLRSAQPSHPMYKEAVDAVDSLRSQGVELCIASQNLVEFRAVATRSLADNGLGMSQAQVKTEIARLKSFFRVLPESPAIFSEWERLVDRYGSVGKQNHDARLVAAMLVHGISDVLTFNKDDFTRYAEIHVLTPQAVLASPGTETPSAP